MNILTPEWPAPENIKSFYTTREHGHSTNPKASFNLSETVNDAQQAVQKNRQLLQTKLHMPTQPCWLQQTHSNIVHHAKITQQNINADACFSNITNIVCTVLTADCVPILLCNQAGTEIAAVHAGWRGLAQGIIKNAIKKFQSENNEIIAWIGPCISTNHYETSTEVRHTFTTNNSALESCFHLSKPGHYHANLAAIAKLLLLQIGVKLVYLSNLCTYSDNRFFSYRQQQNTGRQATGIWINNCNS